MRLINKKIKDCQVCGKAPSVFGNFEIGYKIACRHNKPTFNENTVSANTEDDAVFLWNAKNTPKQNNPNM